MSLTVASKFLDNFETCVVATVSANGHPEAATIGFSHDQKWTILIGTNEQTRKYANLTTNPRCALVVGFEGAQTVQIEGMAREVSEADIAERLPAHFAKVEAAKRFADQPGQRWFVITPVWLRHTNFALPQPIFETKEFA